MCDGWLASVLASSRYGNRSRFVEFHNCTSIRSQLLLCEKRAKETSMLLTRAIMLQLAPKLQYYTLFFSLHHNYLCSFMSSCKRSGFAPMRRSTTSPPLINMKVGIALQDPLTRLNKGQFHNSHQNKSQSKQNTNSLSLSLSPNKPT